MRTKINTKFDLQTKISVLIALVFCSLFIVNLYCFAFVGLFLIASIITFLKKHDVKRVLLLLSPIAVYPALIYCIGQNRKFFDTILLPMSSYAVSYWAFVLAPPVLFGLLYAYLFRETFTTWVAVKYQKLLLILMSVLTAISVLVSPIVRMCETVNLMEFDLNYMQVRTCQLFGLYHTNIADSLSGSATAIQIYVFIPLVIIFFGMAIQYARRDSVSEK